MSGNSPDEWESRAESELREFRSSRHAVMKAALYLREHWPAYWIVLDTWPAELRQAVEVLRGKA